MSAAIKQDHFGRQHNIRHLEPYYDGLAAFQDESILQKNEPVLSEADSETAAAGFLQSNIDLRTLRLASLGSMAVNVGHELNNLATIFQALRRFITVRAHEGLLPEADDLRELQYIGEHLQNHAEQLLSMGVHQAPETPKKNLQVLPLLHRTVRMIQHMGSLKSIDIQIDGNEETEENIAIFGNEIELQQVMINLLQNAKDAIAERDEPNHKGKVRIDLSVEKESVLINVKDNGIGIPKSTIPRLLTPYFSTKSPERGSGLGLSVVRQIIEEHGGHIDIQSIEGKSTTVRLRLPIAHTT